MFESMMDLRYNEIYCIEFGMVSYAIEHAKKYGGYIDDQGKWFNGQYYTLGAVCKESKGEYVGSWSYVEESLAKAKS